MNGSKGEKGAKGEVGQKGQNGTEGARVRIKCMTITKSSVQSISVFRDVKEIVDCPVLLVRLVMLVQLVQKAPRYIHCIVKMCNCYYNGMATKGKP